MYSIFSKNKLISVKSLIRYMHVKFPHSKYISTGLLGLGEGEGLSNTLQHWCVYLTIVELRFANNSTDMSIL